MPCLALQGLHELLFRLLGVHAADLFQFGYLLLAQVFHLVSDVFQMPLPVDQGLLVLLELLLPLVQGGQLIVDQLFALVDPLLDGGHLLEAFLGLLVALALGGKDDLLGLDLGVGDDVRRLLPGFFCHPPGYLFGIPPFLFAYVRIEHVSTGKADDHGNE